MLTIIMLIYLSYADADKRFGNELKKRLNSVVFRQRYGVSCWSMQDAGEDDQREMAEKLDQAAIFIPLASPDAFAEPRCLAEQAAALRLKSEGRLNRIIPVLLRPCALEKTPLEIFEPLPQRGKAITAFRDLDQGWFQVEQGLFKVIRAMQA